MILIDSSVWSIALRRRRRDRNPEETKVFYEWSTLVTIGQAAIIGPVRQEVLSGVHGKTQFQLLKSQLDSVTTAALNQEIWECAAEFFNTCRSNGIAADAVDMTLSAAAYIHNARIFSIDPDFPRYALHLPIVLHTY